MSKPVNPYAQQPQQSQASANPYSAPTAVSHDLFQSNYPAYEVYGKKVLVGNYVELPDLCYKDGTPVRNSSEGKRTHKNLYSCSQWWALLILLGIIGIIIYIAIYYSTRKPVTVSYCLSKASRKKLMLTRLIGYSLSILSLFSAFFLFVTGSEDISFILGFVCIALFFIGLVVTNILSIPVRVSGRIADRFFLTGAGSNFLFEIQNLQNQQAAATAAPLPAQALQTPPPLGSAATPQVRDDGSL